MELRLYISSRCNWKYTGTIWSGWENLHVCFSRVVAAAIHSWLWL